MAGSWPARGTWTLCSLPQTSCESACELVAAVKTATPTALPRSRRYTICMGDPRRGRYSRRMTENRRGVEQGRKNLHRVVESPAGQMAKRTPFSKDEALSSQKGSSRRIERAEWLRKHLGEEEEIVNSLVEHIQSNHIDQFKPRKDIVAQVQVLRSLGLSLKELRRLADLRPKLLVSLPARTMQKKFKYFLDTVGLSKPQLRKVLLKFPRLLEYHTKKTIDQRLAFLESLGIKRDDIPKILCQAPSVMELSVKGTLQPKVNYLLKEVGIPHQSLPTVLVRHPLLLAYRTDTLKARAKFLQLCRFTDSEIVKIVTQHPQVLHYDVNSMSSRLRYFIRIGVSPDKLPAMLTRMPSLLSLDIEMNMGPKFAYLVDELGGDVSSLLQDPVYMGLSLENRIIPRHQFLELMRPECIRMPFPMNWLKCSDTVFAEKVAKVPLEEFERFKSERRVDGDVSKSRVASPV